MALPAFEAHILLCADQTKPKCCDRDTSLEAWDYLKRRLSELGLDLRVHRSKANCLRGCNYAVPGPVLLLYPGGYWYRATTPVAIERILQEHLLAGQPVTELLAEVRPLATLPLNDLPVLDASSTPSSLLP